MHVRRSRHVPFTAKTKMKAVIKIGDHRKEIVMSSDARHIQTFCELSNEEYIITHLNQGRGAGQGRADQYE
jgi:hypothetical protein